MPSHFFKPLNLGVQLGSKSKILQSIRWVSYSCHSGSAFVDSWCGRRWTASDVSLSDGLEEPASLPHKSQGTWEIEKLRVPKEWEKRWKKGVCKNRWTRVEGARLLKEALASRKKYLNVYLLVMVGNSGVDFLQKFRAIWFPKNYLRIDKKWLWLTTNCKCSHSFVFKTYRAILHITELHNVRICILIIWLNN